MWPVQQLVHGQLQLIRKLPTVQILEAPDSSHADPECRNRSARAILGNREDARGTNADLSTAELVRASTYCKLATRETDIDPTLGPSKPDPRTIALDPRTIALDPRTIETGPSDHRTGPSHRRTPRPRTALSQFASNNRKHALDDGVDRQGGGIDVFGAGRERERGCGARLVRQVARLDRFGHRRLSSLASRVSDIKRTAPGPFLRRGIEIDLDVCVGKHDAG